MTYNYKKLCVMKGEIIFKKQKDKYQVVVYLNDYVYNAVEALGKQNYKDKRRVDGILRTYALIVQSGVVGKINNGWTPIESTLFKGVVSKRHYKEYLEKLKEVGYIDIKHMPLQKTTNKDGNAFLTKNTTQYRIGIIGCLFDNQQSTPVILNFDEDMWISIKKKYACIELESLDSKKESIMNKSYIDIATTTRICELVTKIKNGKIKRNKTISTNIEYVSNKYKYDYKDIEHIVYGLLKVIKSKEINEQYIGNNLNKCIDNVSLVQGNCLKFDYYKDVKVDIEIFDRCYCIKDLKHIIRLADIPKYHYDGKLYSAYTNMRRPLREYVCYNGNYLEEAMDISCAHFAMLPKIFEKVGISIPFEEMYEWKKLTQYGDLYGEVAKYGGTTRTLIKPTFQPFLSIKNEKSFIYTAKENDRQNRVIICNFFKNSFPNIYNALLDWHKTINGTSIKSVANMVESEIINPICDRLRSAGLHPFRVNDAIYLPSNEISMVSFDIRQEVFNYINRWESTKHIA